MKDDKVDKLLKECESLMAEELKKHGPLMIAKRAVGTMRAIREGMRHAMDEDDYNSIVSVFDKVVMDINDEYLDNRKDRLLLFAISLGEFAVMQLLLDKTIHNVYAKTSDVEWISKSNLKDLLD